MHAPAALNCFQNTAAPLAMQPALSCFALHHECTGNTSQILPDSALPCLQRVARTTARDEYHAQPAISDFSYRLSRLALQCSGCVSVIIPPQQTRLTTSACCCFYNLMEELL